MDSTFEVIIAKLPYLGIAFSMALIIASLTPRLHKMLHRRNDTIAVQSAHSKPTLRLGGLACFLAMVFGSFSADISASILVNLIFAGAPLFIIGLLEDFGIHMSPKKVKSHVERTAQVKAKAKQSPIRGLSGPTSGASTDAAAPATPTEEPSSSPASSSAAAAAPCDGG